MRLLKICLIGYLQRYKVFLIIKMKRVLILKLALVDNERELEIKDDAAGTLKSITGDVFLLVKYNIDLG